MGGCLRTIQYYSRSTITAIATALSTVAFTIDGAGGDETSTGIW